jgi:hypothetical protein
LAFAVPDYLVRTIGDTAGSRRAAPEGEDLRRLRKLIPGKAVYEDDMAVEHPGSAEDIAARALIAEAAGALATRRSDIPAGFGERLFDHAIPEDVSRYGAAGLADLSERAWDFLTERTPGTAKIRCYTRVLMTPAATGRSR